MLLVLAFDRVGIFLDFDVALIAVGECTTFRPKFATRPRSVLPLPLGGAFALDNLLFAAH